MSFAFQRAPSPDRPSRPMFGTGAGASQCARAGNDHIIPTDNPQLSYVDPGLVEKMRHRLRAQTAECVMDTFGVSVNTWVKMREGKPIRRSVAERLVQRISTEL